MAVSFTQTSKSDAEFLVNIRISAMQESLEQAGRFDLQRARSRFLDTFDPSITKFIEYQNLQVGFVVSKETPTEINLDHFYILPEFQGKNIGTEVLKVIFVEADLKLLPIKLMTLKRSDANRFYLKNGFKQVDVSEWDNHYLRLPNSSLI